MIQVHGPTGRVSDVACQKGSCQVALVVVLRNQTSGRKANSAEVLQSQGPTFEANTDQLPCSNLGCHSCRRAGCPLLAHLKSRALPPTPPIRRELVIGMDEVEAVRGLSEYLR